MYIRVGIHNTKFKKRLCLPTFQARKLPLQIYITSKLAMLYESDEEKTFSKYRRTVLSKGYMDSNISGKKVSKQNINYSMWVFGRKLCQAWRSFYGGFSIVACILSREINIECRIIVSSFVFEWMHIKKASRPTDIHTTSNLVRIQLY